MTSDFANGDSVHNIGLSTPLILLDRRKTLVAGSTSNSELTQNSSNKSPLQKRNTLHLAPPLRNPAPLPGHSTFIIASQQSREESESLTLSSHKQSRKKSGTNLKARDSSKNVFEAKKGQKKSNVNNRNTLNRAQINDDEIAFKNAQMIFSSKKQKVTTKNSDRGL